MSNDIAIKVNNLSKTYKLYSSPQDRLKEALNPLRKKYHRDFYALEGVSFEVRKGETVGIIGKNGAGKSTLLKMITGVLTPTSGSIDINGRISALLELGAGFDKEATGLENIYFSGTIMGFTRQEIDGRVAKIVAFADIGDFIHQPVKTYSSGMRARLAFAVAISIEPDILIVDEALAVGDVSFQYKCYQKMWQMKSNGATLLLVTHSTNHILEQCDKAILLGNGKLLHQDTDVEEVVARYEKLLRNVEEPVSSKAGIESRHLDENDFNAQPNSEIGEKRFGSGRAIIKEIRITNRQESEEDAPVLKSGQKMYIKFLVHARECIDNVVLGVSLRRKDSADIWGDNNLYANHPLSLKQGINRITYETSVNIVSGEYLLLCGLAAFSAGEREELDQRWPVKVVKVASTREGVGFIYSPIRILTGQ